MAHMKVCLACKGLKNQPQKLHRQPPSVRKARLEESVEIATHMQLNVNEALCARSF